VLDIMGQLESVPLDEISYKWKMATAFGSTMVLSVIGTIVYAILGSIFVSVKTARKVGL